MLCFLCVCGLCQAVFGTAAAGTVSMTVESAVSKSGEGTVSTKNGIKRVIDLDPISV